jgi:tRNA A37 N6-isopentenylltransferase MiaA
MTDSNQVPKLSAKQQRALEVLLVGGTDQQAGETAGVSRNTVAQWRTQNEAFVEALSDLRQDLLRRTVARLHAATAIAVKALEELVKDTRYPAVRVTAARAILELSRKAIEIDELEARVHELEEWFEEHKKQLERKG